jgi:hypothetical protein
MGVLTLVLVAERAASAGVAPVLSRLTGIGLLVWAVGLAVGTLMA